MWSWWSDVSSLVRVRVHLIMVGTSRNTSSNTNSLHFAMLYFHDYVLDEQTEVKFLIAQFFPSNNISLFHMPIFLSSFDKVTNIFRTNSCSKIIINKHRFFHARTLFHISIQYSCLKCNNCIMNQAFKALCIFTN